MSDKIHVQSRMTAITVNFNVSHSVKSMIIYIYEYQRSISNQFCKHEEHCCGLVFKKRMDKQKNKRPS